MAKYKDLVGTSVVDVAGDPDNPLTGQLWYNTTENEYRYRRQFAGNAWSAGGNMNTARNHMFSAGVSQTAALVAGGDTGGTPEYFDGTELYDGSSWTEVNNLNTAKRLGVGAGTQTAALAIGGSSDPGAALTEVESWDGTNWTEITDFNTARQQAAGGGTQTSALYFGGVNPPPTVKGETESWNGSSWTEVSDLNTARGQHTGFGADNTSALAAGGSPNRAQTESWNGSSWTEIADLNTGRRNLAGSGGVPSGLVFGGESSTVNLISNTELWNGTSWSETTDLSTARQNGKGAGPTSSNTSSLFSGGTDAAFTGATEEWNANVAIGAWLTGANLNTTRRGLNAQNVGTQTAAMAIGGFQPPRITNTELYNGTSWSEVNDINLARFNGGGVGVQTSALYFGGSSGNPSPENPGFTRENKNELWNGYTWTETTDLNTGRSDTCGAGANNTAALCVAGKNPASNPPGGLLAIVESWNGSNWTEVGDLNDNKESLSCVGTQTAALAIGGNTATDYVGQTESWNGSSWTELNDMNTGRSAANASGDSTSALNFGGYTGTAYTGSSELWNGTNWSNVSDLNTPRGQPGGAQGSSTAGLAFGGYTGTANTNATEEWYGTGLVTQTVTTTSD